MPTDPAPPKPQSYFQPPPPEAFGRKRNDSFDKDASRCSSPGNESKSELKAGRADGNLRL